MITHVRNLIQDLVERRLWPVALVLAVALAAVPVVLGRGGDETASTAALPAAPATPSTAPQKAEVTLDTSAPADRERPGAVRNPFKAPVTHTAKKAATATAAAAAPAAASPSAPASTPSSPSPSPSSSSSGSPSSGSPTPSTPSGGTASGTPKPATPTPKPKATTTKKPTADDAADTYHVALKIGVVKPDGTVDPKTLGDVARLSPLPSVTDPFFVYLGVLQTTGAKPEKRAVFLVSSDATPNGEGACHPTKNDCESVELAVGETAFFDYTAPSGAVTQYQLELTGIHKTQVTSAAKASAAVARHSVAGAELLRDAATRNVRAAAGARAYRYVPATGLLRRAKRRHVSARAAAAGTLVPGLALVAPEHQPGMAVWRSPKKK
jgi:hypothetical protein